MKPFFGQGSKPLRISALLIAGVVCAGSAFAQNDRDIADGNRMFDWAERRLPDFFSPAGVRTQTINGFVVRYYPFSNTWLGVNGDMVYVYGPAFNALPPEGLSLKSVGSIENFLDIARAERNVPGSGGGDRNEILDQADQDDELREASPVRRIDRDRQRGENRGPAEEGFRRIDGQENNRNQPTMGSVGIQLVRMVPADYTDGISSLAGQDRPSPRDISNIVSTQSDSMPNSANASDMLWQWGQFLDHDIDLTDGVSPEEPANIAVPTGDPFFDPTSVGTAVISLNRSVYDTTTGTASNNPRQQINEITAWVDASNVYGSESERADALRTNDGTGQLKVSAGDLLPFNEEGLPNAGGNSSALFLAGDVRANEQVGLLSMHTLFVREHNRLAAEIAQQNPNLNGDQIYERARKIVGAQMQVITYEEYLPLLMGRDALSPYRGYEPNVDASIANVFSTAAYRYGHSALSPTLLRLDANGNEIADGHLALRDAFFSPQRLSAEGGLDPIFRGLTQQVCQEIDPFVIDDVRNFLFGPPGAGGFDLAALNIQRGRDHGLSNYNDARAALGLQRKRSFADISSDPEIQSRLANAYGSVGNIDAWVGGLAEDPVSGAMVGEFVFTVLKRQFEALRDGDRFWYRQTLTQDEIREVEETTLADIIRRNTGIDQELGNDAFRVRN